MLWHLEMTEWCYTELNGIWHGRQGLENVFRTHSKSKI